MTPSENSITATRRSTKGDYLNQSAIPTVTGTGYNEDESELLGYLKLSEKSQLTGRLARRARSNNQIGQRNFSGPAGDLGYTWKPTSKLNVNVSASRNTSPLQDPSFSFIAANSFSFAPTLQVTGKIAVRMRLSHDNSAYRGEGIVPANSPGRKDSVNNAEIAVDWSPRRNLSVTTSLQHQRRSSNNALFEYDDKMGNISASWLF